ncbi:hypothetical protein BJV74DRAFT_879552 [Russula compacta]|nr:hypothetical protein BJV74DRAFT_879552 [Russula compacta]
MAKEKLDYHIRCLPPAYGMRHFKNGFSALFQLSGLERKNTTKILLGCLVGKLPKKAIIACRSLLDFIYLAQYTTYDSIILGYMEDALKTFHDNKSHFVEQGIQQDLNIPKFHSLDHYLQSIKLLGWRASNQRDAFPQIIKWLSRQEKMYAFKHYEYLNHLGPNPTSSRIAASQSLPFQRLDVYHTFKFHPPNLEDNVEECNVIKVAPTINKRPSHFDTAVILDTDNAESTGLEETRIGHVCVIFTLPSSLDQGIRESPSYWPKIPLGCIEWFLRLKPAAEDYHNMYSIKKVSHPDGSQYISIVPLSSICQSCMLFPQFGCAVDRTWAIEDVLDTCSSFLVNNWQSLYSYKTIW